MKRIILALVLISSNIKSGDRKETDLEEAGRRAVSQNPIQSYIEDFLKSDDSLRTMEVIVEMQKVVTAAIISLATDLNKIEECTKKLSSFTNEKPEEKHHKMIVMLIELSKELAKQRKEKSGAVLFRAVACSIRAIKKIPINLDEDICTIM